MLLRVAYLHLNNVYSPGQENGEWGAALVRLEQRDEHGKATELTFLFASSASFLAAASLSACGWRPTLCMCVFVHGCVRTCVGRCMLVHVCVDVVRGRDRTCM